MTPPELQASGKEMVMHSTAKNDSVAARCSRSRSRSRSRSDVASSLTAICRLAEQKKKNEQAGSWLSKVGKALWII
jgi:hypothetical protein